MGNVCSGGEAQTKVQMDPPGRRRSIVALDTNKKGEKITSQAGKQVGFFSNHGWEQKTTFLGGKGPVKPKINQDRIFITPKLNDRDDCWLFACFDGNGPKGEKVAHECGNELVRILENAGSQTGVKFTDEKADVPSLLMSAFEAVNQSVTKNSFAEKSGSTATAIFVKGKKVYIANVGDSKAVRGTVDEKGNLKAVSLTKDHKPADAEKERILECGGFVLDDAAKYGAARIFDTPDPVAQMAKVQEWYRKQRNAQNGPGGMGGMGGIGGGMGGYGMGGGDMGMKSSGMSGFRGMHSEDGLDEENDASSLSISKMPTEPWPGLAVSRCLGHTGVVSIGIIATPEVTSFDVTDEDRCLIVASDGVWDFVDEDEAYQMCMDLRPDADAACRALVETASQRWIEDDPTYRDDISACVIFTPLDVALDTSVSHETVSYTADSLSAIRDAKAESEAPAAEAEAKAPPPPPGTAAAVEATKSAVAKPSLAVGKVAPTSSGVASTDRGGFGGLGFGSSRAASKSGGATDRGKSEAEAKKALAAGAKAVEKKGDAAKGITANKSQRRRSVVTNFTG